MKKAPWKRTCMRKSWILGFHCEFSGVCIYGCFQKEWYPQIIHFNRVFHHKPSILGYPYFRKHPYFVEKNMRVSLRVSETTLDLGLLVELFDQVECFSCNALWATTLSGCPQQNEGNWCVCMVTGSSRKGACTISSQLCPFYKHIIWENFIEMLPQRIVDIGSIESSKHFLTKNPPWWKLQISQISMAKVPVTTQL